jgi:hypothetical protein
MGRPKGEAGERPALSRNCKLIYTCLEGRYRLISQDECLDPPNYNPRGRRWDGNRK